MAALLFDILLTKYLYAIHVHSDNLKDLLFSDLYNHLSEVQKKNTSMLVRDKFKQIEHERKQNEKTNKNP